MTTPQAQPATMLWTDSNIHIAAGNASDDYVRGYDITVMEVCAKQLRIMRDEYEAKLDDYQGVYLYYLEKAEKDERRIVELEQLVRKLSGGEP